VSAEVTEKNVVERLAALSFWQWQAWTRFFLQGKHTPADLYEWVRLLNVKYADLTEEQKDDYRFWARKMLEVTGDVE
jgi:hypothetical protein